MRVRWVPVVVAPALVLVVLLVFLCSLVVALVLVFRLWCCSCDGRLCSLVLRLWCLCSVRLWSHPVLFC